MTLRAYGLAVVLLLPVFAEAQPELSPLQRPSRPMIEAAQQHYLTGTRFFEEGQWDASLVEFIASFQLSGERDLLFNISWTHEKAGRAREALDYAERYLAACRGSEDEERAAKRVAFLKAKYGQSASATASTVQPAVEVPVATPTTQNAASGATAAPSSEGKARPPAVAIGLLAGGGALALGGIGCLVGAWSTAAQASSADLTFAQGSGLIDRGHALNATGIALTVTGGALVIGGAVTWAVLARRGLK